MAQHASEALPPHAGTDHTGKKIPSRRKRRVQKPAPRGEGEPNSKAKKPRPSRSKREALAAFPQVERLSWSIPEWAAARGYSESFVAKLMRENRGPDVVREGRTTRVTREADARWQAEREAKAKTAPAT